MAKSSRTGTPHVRHLRYRRYDRMRKDGTTIKEFADAQATRLTASATGQNFTTAAALATGTLTLTGLPLDTETMTIGSRVYTFQTTLTEADGNIKIQGTAAAQVTAIVAALTGNNRVTQATGVLTLTGNALNTETVTIGSTTYTFQTSLVDSANNVLIGATASDSIDNLIAALTAGAGAGTLYGTGTVANGDVTAAAGVGDTLDLTATAIGDAGNTVATTETLTNGSFGGATLSGGVTNYAAAMTANTEVTAADGVGDTVDLTAVVYGVAGNSIATTETLTNGSFGAANLAGGVDGEDLTVATHGISGGEGPYNLTTTTTLPLGLATATDYWVSVVDANTINLSLSRGGPVVRPGDGGTGTHTLTKASDGAAIVDIMRQHPAREVAAASDIDDLN